MTEESCWLYAMCWIKEILHCVPCSEWQLDSSLRALFWMTIRFFTSQLRWIISIKMHFDFISALNDNYIPFVIQREVWSKNLVVRMQCVDKRDSSLRALFWMTIEFRLSFRGKYDRRILLLIINIFDKRGSSLRALFWMTIEFRLSFRGKYDRRILLVVCNVLRKEILHCVPCSEWQLDSSLRSYAV
jgi:hypothetical protein